MAIAFTAATTSATIANTDGVVVDPSTAPGQFVLVGFGDDDVALNPVTCTGYTQESNVFESGDGGQTALLFNVNAAGVGGNLHFPASTAACEAAVAFTGVSTTTPFDVTPTFTNSAAGGGSSTTWTITAPSITTVTDGCQILIFIMTDPGNTTDVTAATATGFTNRGIALGRAGGNSFTACTVLTQNALQTTHGATGTTTVTLTQTAAQSGGWVVYTVALRPGGTVAAVNSLFFGAGTTS